MKINRFLKLSDNNFMVMDILHRVNLYRYSFMSMDLSALLRLSILTIVLTRNFIVTQMKISHSHVSISVSMEMRLLRLMEILRSMSMEHKGQVPDIV